MKIMWAVCGTMIGLTSLSLALGAVPSQRMRVTDDTAIYQNMSEIRVAREKRPDFDADIQRLSSLESRYREILPTLKNGGRGPRPRIGKVNPSLTAPMQRVSSQKYRYSGGSAQTGNVVKN